MSSIVNPRLSQSLLLTTSTLVATPRLPLPARAPTRSSASLAVPDLPRRLRRSWTLRWPTTSWLAMPMARTPTVLPRLLPPLMVMLRWRMRSCKSGHARSLADSFPFLFIVERHGYGYDTKTHKIPTRGFPIGCRSRRSPHPQFVHQGHREVMAELRTFFTIFYSMLFVCFHGGIQTESRAGFLIEVGVVI